MAPEKTHAMRFQSQPHGHETVNRGLKPDWQPPPPGLNTLSP